MKILLGVMGFVDLWLNLVRVRKVGVFGENKKVELWSIEGFVDRGEMRLEAVMVCWENKGFGFGFPMTRNSSKRLRRRI